MPPVALDALRESLARAGRDRELSLPGADAILQQWREGLEEFVAHYQQQFGETVDPFALWDTNAPKARAFFEPDTLNYTLTIKAAVWHLLLGYEIRHLELRFRPDPNGSFLRLELAAPGDTQARVFQSTDPNDVKLVRHLGTIRVDGRLELQGYHAFFT